MCWPSATASTPDRLILGNGAAELLSAATRALLEPGQQLLDPLALLPAVSAHGPARARARRAGRGRRRRADRGRRREGDVRVIALASPNDPTGELLARAELERLLEGCRRAWRCCSTRRSSTSPTPSPIDSSLELLEQHRSLLVFRSFSKAWGLAGLRIGYAIGGPGSGELLAELDPDLGVSEISQAGALEALRSCSELVEARTRGLRGAPAS